MSKDMSNTERFKHFANLRLKNTLVSLLILSCLCNKRSYEYSENVLDKSEAYEILGLSVAATLDQVKKRFRELALKWHPDTYKGDKTVAEKMMMKINQAYETIMVAA